MPKKAARAAQADVVVLGCHPSAFLAVALLKQIAGLQIVHASLAGEKYIDRLVLVNPKLFDLHPLLNGVQHELTLTPTYGLRFLGDERGLENSFTSKSVTAFVASFKQVQSVLQKRAGVHGEVVANLEIHGMDETGVDLTLGKNRLRTKLILLAGPVEASHRQILGLPEKWDAEVMHRYSFIKCRSSKLEAIAQPGEALIPMSLDLGGTLHWAWLLAAGEHVQLAIEQPVERFAEKQVRVRNGITCGNGAAVGECAERSPNDQASKDRYKSGHDDRAAVRRRTGSGSGRESNAAIRPGRGVLHGLCRGNVSVLLVGHLCGGCGEGGVERTLHPRCLARVIARSGAARLGDYLRGPQQNLKFLLPLVYRNPTMATRLAEAILTGESVVR